MKVIKNVAMVLVLSMIAIPLFAPRGGRGGGRAGGRPMEFHRGGRGGRGMMGRHWSPGMRHVGSGMRHVGPERHWYGGVGRHYPRNWGWRTGWPYPHPGAILMYAGLPYIFDGSYWLPYEDELDDYVYSQGPYYYAEPCDDCAEIESPFFGGPAFSFGVGLGI